jgi:hypothetical protein
MRDGAGKDKPQEKIRKYCRVNNFPKIIQRNKRRYFELK